MSMTWKAAAFATGILAAGAADAAVVLVTSDAGYSGPALDLSAYSNGTYNFTFGPIALPGGITFTAAPGGGGNSGLGSVVGQGGYGLGDNGSFGGAATYIGVDSATGNATLTFADAVKSFGGYWNYLVFGGTTFGDPPVIEALDALGAVLGAFDLSLLAPISTPGGTNQFAFRGIESDSADIKSIRFGGSYLLLAGTPNGDTPSPVPLPAAAPLLLAGLGLLRLAGARRRG